MAGNLIQARVRVVWGKINLSAYNGDLAFPQGEPLVYDVEVNMQAETQSPTASMKWNPTGPAMEVYESFLTNKELMATQIVIEFFYSNGKRLPMFFVWSGQSIAYGNDMTITVKMQSELSGLVNANIRNIAQADDSKKGVTGVELVNYAQKQFGLAKYTDLVTYEDIALKDMEKAKFETNYASDSTFGAQIGNIAQQNGNMAMATNIGKAQMVVYSPFSWSKDGVVKNAATDIPVGGFPDPKVRYGYILGPSLINTITRNFDWKPPQQTNSNTPNTQTRALPPRDKYGRFTAVTPAQPQNAQSNTLKPTEAPVGTSNGRSTPGIGNKDNPDQVPKQNALNEEKSSTLNMSTYCVPVLMGIKPNDIIYIPSLTGKYMEDWIVQSVDYNQNDGKVEIGIQATRVYGAGSPMNQKQADTFLKFAKDNKLVGPDATLEAWDKYAWTLGGAANAKDSTQFFTEGSAVFQNPEFDTEALPQELNLSGANALS